MRLKNIAVVGVVMLCAGLVYGEMIDNPQYQGWKKFAEGSSATLTSTINAGGQKVESESVRKLVSKADDAVTIEVTANVTFAGQAHTSPAHQQKIPAQIDKKDAQVSTSSEKVEAAGKTFDCKVYNVTQTTPDGKTVNAKVWITDDVPGGVVKMEAKSDRGDVTSILKSYEAK